MSQPHPLSGEAYHGGCFCRALTYTVTGPPALRAYCHCSQCQRFTGCPFIFTIHFPELAFTWTVDHEDRVDSFMNPSKPWKTRFRCKHCGCAVASHNSKTGTFSVWGGQLDRGEDGKIKGWEDIKPTAHIFYDTRIVDVSDALWKWTGYENESARIG